MVKGSRPEFLYDTVNIPRKHDKLLKWFMEKDLKQFGGNSWTNGDKKDGNGDKDV